MVKPFIGIRVFIVKTLFLFQKTCLQINILHISKSRNTNAEATVAQLFNIAASRNRAVFDFGAPFLVLQSGVEGFGQAKK
jgi:hypothetical protein